MEAQLKDLVSNLDSTFGDFSNKLEELEALRTELGYMADSVANTDLSDMTSSALQFIDMSHKVILLSSLLHYLVKDFERCYTEGYEIKSELFQKVIKENMDNEQ